MPHITIQYGDGLTQGYLRLLEQMQDEGKIDKDVDLKKIKRSQWNSVIEAFININNNRKANGEKEIYTGGSEYEKNDWRHNFKVKMGDIELTDAELNELNASLGLEISGKKETNKKEVKQEAPAEEVKQEAPAEEVKQEAPAEKVKQEASAEEVKQEAPAEKVKQEAPAQNLGKTDAAKGKAPEITNTTNASETTNTAKEKETNTVPESKGTNEAPESKDASKISDLTDVRKELIDKKQAGGPNGNYDTSIPQSSKPKSTTSSVKEFDEKQYKADLAVASDRNHISADVIKLETKALNEGIALRDQATKVDLTVFKKNYGTPEETEETEVTSETEPKEEQPSYWDNTIDDYFDKKFDKTFKDATKNGVKGDEYDFNSKTIKDRVLEEEPKITVVKDEEGKSVEKEEEQDLKQVFKENNLNELIKNETKTDTDKQGIDLNSIDGVKILELENLTLENTNDKIGEVGEALSKAADKVQEGLDIVNKKLQQAKANVESQNENIESQISIIEEQKRYILEHCIEEREDDKENLKTYNAYKNLIDQTEGDDNYNNYTESAYLPRQAKDRALLRAQIANMKVAETTDEEGNFTGYAWDFSEIEDETKREDVQKALTRMSNMDKRIPDGILLIGTTMTEIGKARDGVVGGLKNVAKYDILSDELTKLHEALAVRAKEITAIGENLTKIDKFLEEANDVRKNKHEKEDKKLKTAEDKVQTSIDGVKEASAQSRKALSENKDMKSYEGKSDDDVTKNASAKASKAENKAKKADKRFETELEQREINDKYQMALDNYIIAEAKYKPQTDVKELFYLTDKETPVPETLKLAYAKFVRTYPTETYGYTSEYNQDSNEITIYNKVGKKVITIDVRTKENAISMFDFSKVLSEELPSEKEQ